MGADFVALIPSESTGMSYSCVHTVRSKLINMVDKELGGIFDTTNWVSKSGLVFDTVAQNYELVIQGLTQMLNASGDDVIAGVLAFVNHSDCDGAFYGADCELILKALKKLQETDDDEVIESLIKVFDNAVSDNGIVAIW